jgi:hypothetical protein
MGTKFESSNFKIICMRDNLFLSLSTNLKAVLNSKLNQLSFETYLLLKDWKAFESFAKEKFAKKLIKTIFSKLIFLPKLKRESNSLAFRINSIVFLLKIKTICNLITYYRLNQSISDSKNQLTEKNFKEFEPKKWY